MWQNTVTYTVGGKTYNRQEKLSSLKGCPAIGAVGWAFIYLAIAMVVLAIGVAVRD